MGDLVEVVVKTADGEAVRLDVASTSTVRDLKEQTQSPELHLRASPRPVSDHCPIGSIDLPTLVFSAVLPPREVTFKVPDGRTVRIRYSNRTQIAKAVTEICTILDIRHRATLRVLHKGEPIGNDCYISDLNLAAEDFLKIEDPPRRLNVVYRSPQGHTKVAVTRYRGIASAGAVRTRLDASFHISGVRTGLFHDGDLVADDVVLGDLELPADATLEFRPLPEASLTIHAPKKLITARYKETATVRRAKDVLARTLDLEPDAVVFGRADDDALLRDLIDGEEVSIHIYQPLTIEVSGRWIRARYAETATIRSAKQKIADAIQVPVGRLKFELEYSDEETRITELNLPPTEVVRLVDTHPRKDDEPVSAKAGVGEEEEEEEEVQNIDLDEDLVADRPQDSVGPGPRFDEVKWAEENDQMVEPEEERVREAERGVKLVAYEKGVVEEEEEDETVPNRVPRAAQSQRIVFKFPAGHYVKGRFQPRATVGKLRGVVAEELNIDPDNLILKYGANTLTDEQLIADLNIPRAAFIAILTQ
jgi:hypothetical protein